MAKAMYDGTCESCECQIERGQEVALRKGGWVHASCVNGGSDE